MSKDKKPVVHKRIMSAELEREQRRRRVASLYARGMSPREIAGVLNVVMATVTKDLNAIRSDISRHVTSMNPKELAVAVLGNLQEVLRATWALYSSAESENTKLNSLRLIAKEESHLIYLLHSLGYGMPDTKTGAPYDPLAETIEKFTNEELCERLRSLLKDLESGEGGGSEKP
jgi:transposase